MYVRLALQLACSWRHARHAVRPPSSTDPLRFSYLSSALGARWRFRAIRARFSILQLHDSHAAPPSASRGIVDATSILLAKIHALFSARSASLDCQACSPRRRPRLLAYHFKARPCQLCADFAACGEKGDCRHDFQYFSQFTTPGLLPSPLHNSHAQRFCGHSALLTGAQFLFIAETMPLPRSGHRAAPAHQPASDTLCYSPFPRHRLLPQKPATRYYC